MSRRRPLSKTGERVIAKASVGLTSAPLGLRPGRIYPESPMATEGVDVITAETAAGLDVGRSHKAKYQSGKLIAQCPACAASGGHEAGNYPVIFNGGDGKWECFEFFGDKDHRRRIAEEVGTSNTERPLPAGITDRGADCATCLQLPSLRSVIVARVAMHHQTTRPPVHRSPQAREPSRHAALRHDPRCEQFN